MKSVPSNLPNFTRERKNVLKFEPKIPYLGIFSAEYQKNIVIFEINNIEFVENEFLTQTVNFGIWSSFLKVQSLLFLKVTRSGSGCSL